MLTGLDAFRCQVARPDARRAICSGEGEFADVLRGSFWEGMGSFGHHKICMDNAIIVCAENTATSHNTRFFAVLVGASCAFDVEPGESELPRIK